MPGSHLLISFANIFGSLFCHLQIFFSKSNFFKKIFQEYHEKVKQFASRSGLMFCRALSGSIQTVWKGHQQTNDTSRQGVNSRSVSSSGCECTWGILRKRISQF